MLLSLRSRLRSLPVPRPVVAVAAAALPAGALAAALSLSGAVDARYFPQEPKAPSPYLLAETEGAGGGACQVGALVKDGSDARPGAPLQLSRVTADGSAEVWRAVADKNGTHRFIDLPAGNYQLTALVDDRAPAAMDFHCTGAADRAFFTLPLVATDHVFSGRVTSKDGKLAPGAELAIAQDIDARTSLAGTARIPVDHDGNFSLRLAPGRYVMLAQAPNHAPTLRKVSIDADTAQSKARVVLTPAPHVTGRVVDEDGAPVAGALVALGGTFDPKQRAASVKTEADGTFSLPVADGQDVVITAHATSRDGKGGNAGGEGGLVARAALGVAQSALGFTDVELVAHAGRAVEGTVTKPDGSVWAFGAVRYRVRDLGLTGIEKADADGHFVVAGMPPDADVEVWAEGNATGAWGAQVATPGNDKLALVYVPPAY